MAGRLPGSFSVNSLVSVVTTRLAALALALAAAGTGPLSPPQPEPRYYGHGTRAYTVGGNTLYIVISARRCTSKRTIGTGYYPLASYRVLRYCHSYILY
jgi:hypothetical protein